MATLQSSWIFDWNHLAIFDLQVADTSYQVSSQLALRLRRRRKIDFQNGDHLGFLIGTIFAIFNLKDTLIQPLMMK